MFDGWAGGSGWRVPEEYRSGVVWHNIMADERFDDTTEEVAFASLLDRVLDPAMVLPAPDPSAILEFLRWASPPASTAGLQQEFLQDAFCRGMRIPAPPDGIAPDSDGWNRLASLVRYCEPPEDIDMSLDAGKSYLKWLCGVHPRLHNPYARLKGVVWLTRYSILGDLFVAGDKDGVVVPGPAVLDAVASVGVECHEGDRFVLMVVDSAAVWQDLRIPTVADSRFYYMWCATRKDEGPHGMTRHTRDGKKHGVPELVVRIQDLAHQLDSGAVRLQVADQPDGTKPVVSGVSEESLRISETHARTRWSTEIVRVI
jgi:hypothetical protein